jgi:predicted CXXCH cytochrome family protein
MTLFQTLDLGAAVRHLARRYGRSGNPRCFGLGRWVPLLFVLAGLASIPAVAIDPPHVTAALCNSCHMSHLNPGGDLTTVAGNGNLCISCHQPGGTASLKPFANSDQALPWSGLPAGAVPGGTSHRWDANAAGHVAFLGGAAIPSTGTVVPTGVFTGPYPKTYTLTITTSGSVGTAAFSWVATTPGGGAGNNVLTSGTVPLDQGVSVSFLNGTGVSFQVNDRWNLFVRSGLSNPTNALMLAHMVNGVASCSACHDEHSQKLTPFDPNAPAYSTVTSNGVMITWTALSNFTYRVQYKTGLAITNWFDLTPDVTATASTASYLDPTAFYDPQRYYRVLVVSAATNRPYIQSLKRSAATNTFVARHFMRVNNDQDQMCYDCHAPYNVTNSLAGSHPVGISAPLDNLHKPPTQLPLEKATANIGCLTCHQVHFSPAGDARVLRLASSVPVCTDCHLQSDTVTPAAHFAATNSATLWPGGRFGSLMPARTRPADQGTCFNCHAVHGWPDTANPTNHYVKLLADFEENLCYTCHGTNGPAVKQVQLDFAKTYHHPVANAQQVGGRKVECIDCHNSHKALAGSAVYTNTATVGRNTVTNAPSLVGASGVAVDYTGLGNFVVPPP